MNNNFPMNAIYAGVPPYYCPLCNVEITAGRPDDFSAYFGTCGDCHITARMDTQEITYYNPKYWKDKKKAFQLNWKYNLSLLINKVATESK